MYIIKIILLKFLYLKVYGYVICMCNMGCDNYCKIDRLFVSIWRMEKDGYRVCSI